MKVCFLIRRMDRGGAERQLLSLVRGLDPQQFTIAVMEYYDGGGFVPELLKIPGLTRVCLDKKGRWDSLPFIRRLIRELNVFSPDIIHGYGEPANFLSILVKPFLKRPVKTVFGIRSSNMHLERHDTVTRFTGFLERQLSSFSDLVIANSIAGRDYCIANGFPEERTIAIPNGIDTDFFHPNIQERSEQRATWQVGNDECLVGLVARLDPKKNHPEFLRAAKIFLSTYPRARFVLVGASHNRVYRGELESLSRDLGIQDRLIWAGENRNMRAVYNALDICALCSNAAEGFPNVVAESMACGLIPVVTNAGDTKHIVGDIGILIEDAKPETIAEGWKLALTRDRSEVGMLARQRIVSEFSPQLLAQRTAAALQGLVDQKKTQIQSLKAA